MHVFGLTGGIASGKSAVASVFREEGVPVVDADEVARAIVAPGTEGLAAIVEVFGHEVLDVAGSLDRKALGARVFQDSESRRRLEQLLHPRIAALSASRFAALSEQGNKLICYDAALLVENGLADGFRPLVVVAAHRSTQLQRLRLRDGLSVEEASARLDAQADIHRKLAAADLTIWNDGDLPTLYARAREALAEVRRRLAV